MSPARLQLYGELLFGEVWSDSIAAELDVHPRTMRRWCNGTAPIPDTIEPELHHALQLRYHQIIKFLEHP